jgi:hypothetical protein
VTSTLVAAPFGSPFAAMNTIGPVAFALVGAAKAIREEFDLFGIAVVGLAMAFAGGVTRDLLVSRVPLAPVADRDRPRAARSRPGDRAAGRPAVPGASPGHARRGRDRARRLRHDRRDRRDRGGRLGVRRRRRRDDQRGGRRGVRGLLLDRSPFILFDDFYASRAVLGGSAYWLAGVAGAAEGTAAAACAAVTVAVRLAAVAYGWELPAVRELGLPGE